MDLIELWSIYSPKWSGQTYLLIGITAGVLFLALWRLFTVKKRKKGRMCAAFLAVWYLIFVYGSTVFTRIPQPGYSYCLELFWSYRWGIRIYGNQMLKEIFLNCIMLMPLGVLIPVIFPKAGKHESFTVFTGFLISCSIEFLQLALKRGLFEFDDIIHNTVGVAVGYFIYRLALALSRLSLPETQKRQISDI